MVRVTDCYSFLIIYTLWWDSLSLSVSLSLSLHKLTRIFAGFFFFSNATFSSQQNNTTSFEFASNHFFTHITQLIHPPSSSIPLNSLSFLLRIKQGMLCIHQYYSSIFILILACILFNLSYVMASFQRIIPHIIPIKGLSSHNIICYSLLLLL